MMMPRDLIHPFRQIVRDQLYQERLQERLAREPEDALWNAHRARSAQLAMALHELRTGLPAFTSPGAERLRTMLYEVMPALQGES